MYLLATLFVLPNYILELSGLMGTTGWGDMPYSKALLVFIIGTMSIFRIAAFAQSNQQDPLIYHSGVISGASYTKTFFLNRPFVLDCAARITATLVLSILDQDDYARVQQSQPALRPLMKIGKGMSTLQPENQISVRDFIAVVIENDTGSYGEYELVCRERKTSDP